MTILALWIESIQYRKEVLCILSVCDILILGGNMYMYMYCFYLFLAQKSEYMDAGKPDVGIKSMCAEIHKYMSCDKLLKV